MSEQKRIQEEEVRDSIINYSEEEAKLAEMVEYFKPEEGRYQVTPLQEMEHYEATFQDGEKKEMARFRASILPSNGRMYEALYSLPRSSSRSSHYGQIIRYAKKHGQLTGKTFTLLVSGSGMNKRYQIPDIFDD